MNYQTIIKELREQKGISQEKLSEDSGVSLRTIQRIENGECTPRESSLRTIAKSLNVPLESLVNNPVDETEVEHQNVHIQSNKLGSSKVYRIAFTLIGATLGFILGLLIIELRLFERVEEGFFPPSLAILVGAIGLLIGSNMDKRNAHKFNNQPL